MKYVEIKKEKCCDWIIKLVSNKNEFIILEFFKEHLVLQNTYIIKDKAEVEYNLSISKHNQKCMQMGMKNVYYNYHKSTILFFCRWDKKMIYEKDIKNYGFMPILLSLVNFVNIKYALHLLETHNKEVNVLKK